MFDECQEAIVNDNVSNVLARLKQLSPKDRYHLVMEHCEDLFGDYDPEDTLVVPGEWKVDV